MTDSSDPYLNSNSADKSTPLEKYPINSTHLVQTIRVVGRYTNAVAIQDLAVQKWKMNGRGITYNDLVGVKKNHAQSTLKYHVRKGNLFTLKAAKPQQYYPKCLEAEVLGSQYQKSTPITPTVVSNFSHGITGHAVSCSGAKAPSPICKIFPGIKANSLDEVFAHIPFYPSLIHKLQMKLNIDPNYTISDCSDIAQYHKQPLGSVYTTYAIQPTGTVCVDLACTNRPFRLAADSDISYLFSVLGQTRHILLDILKDPRERIVPPILDWFLLCFDISRDVPITTSARIFLPKYNPLSLLDVDRVFRLYTKSAGRDTIYRVEESVTLKDTPVSVGIDTARYTGDNPDWLKPVAASLGIKDCST